ncbi:DUF6134 family protein [Algoriphagus litoralis]|uniref:DUF6134 family protein n=1 Tax=Algoriphagus litoralis TaxID=2202829 RepID=UPI0018E59CF6|nr:DUF6134 family protein [Algoriphagus litoralis]
MFPIQRTSTMVGAAVSQRLALLLLVFAFSAQDGKAQNFATERNYEITVLGFSIGEMTANRSTSRDTTIYQVSSEVSFWFFGKVNVDFSVDTRLKDKQIVRTESFSSSNKGDFESKIKWKGDFYEVNASTYKFENTKPIKKPLYLSSVMLFFHEPKEGDDFLGEVFGLVSKVKKIENNGYEVTINGNTNRYYYKNGIMVKAEMESPIKNYLIKLVE